MSTSALLASLAILYGIAQADPAVFTTTDADPIGAVTAPAAVAAGLNSIALSNPDNGAGMATPVTAHVGPGITGGTPVMPAEPSAARMQPFDRTVGATLNGFDNSRPGVKGTRTFTPGAPGANSQPLFTGLSFSFGAELYTQQPDSFAAVPEASTQATIFGFVGLGIMPYLVARSMLSQPDRFAFTVRSK